MKTKAESSLGMGPVGTVTIYLHSELAPGVVIDINVSGLSIESEHLVMSATKAMNMTIKKLDRISYKETLREGFDNLLSPAVRRLSTNEYNQLLDNLLKQC